MVFLYHGLCLCEPMITFHIVTIFPEVFKGYLEESILKRAQRSRKVSFRFYNPRDFASDKHKRVDDKPYGGGPGMVMKAGPILKAVEAALSKHGVRNSSVKKKIIILSPSGKQLTNIYAERLAKQYRHIVLIAGRYEGIDARVKKALRAEEVSVGPYTLTGGEVPAMVVIDAVARRIKGVLGNELSIEEKRTSAGEVYTRPETMVRKGKRYSVPKVLLSGSHKEIDKWKKKSRRA